MNLCSLEMQLSLVAKLIIGFFDAKQQERSQFSSVHDDFVKAEAVEEGGDGGAGVFAGGVEDAVG